MSAERPSPVPSKHFASDSRRFTRREQRLFDQRSSKTDVSGSLCSGMMHGLKKTNSLMHDGNFTESDGLRDFHVANASYKNLYLMGIFGVKKHHSNGRGSKVMSGYKVTS